MAYMNRQAKTVYLKATPEILTQHLRMSKTERPLLKGKNDEELIQYISTSLETRTHYYSRAHYTFDVTLLDNSENIKDAVRSLKELLNT